MIAQFISCMTYNNSSCNSAKTRNAQYSAKKKVLIIDDDDIVLVVVKQYLEKEGYTVFAQSDSQSIDAFIVKFEPDILITDILMPDKDGIEIIRQVKSQFPAIPVIAISAGGRIDAKFHLRHIEMLGADAIMKKPIDKDELINNIRKLI